MGHEDLGQQTLAGSGLVRLPLRHPWDVEMTPRQQRAREIDFHLWRTNRSCRRDEPHLGQTSWVILVPLHLYLGSTHLVIPSLGKARLMQYNACHVA